MLRAPIRGAPSSDPYFDNVVLLAKFDEPGGDVDETQRHTLTLSGGAAVSTTQKKFGGQSLLVGTVAGGGARAVVSGPVTDWQFGAGQFTTEAWVYFTGVGSTYRILAQYGQAGQQSWTLRQNANNLGFIYSADGTATTTIDGAAIPSAGVWYHVAADRDAGGTLRVYRDGVVIASGSAPGFFASSLDLRIGNDAGAGFNFVGYIDEVRITKGVARYAGAFTPPAASFTIPSSSAAAPRRLPASLRAA